MKFCNKVIPIISIIILVIVLIVQLVLFNWTLLPISDNAMILTDGLIDLKIHSILFIVIDFIILISFSYSYKSIRMKVVFIFFLCSICVIIYHFIKSPLQLNKIFHFISNSYSYMRIMNWINYWLITVNLIIIYIVSFILTKVQHRYP